MLKVAGLIESSVYQLQTEEVVEMVERYYAPHSTLKSKID
jgi:hypothetical protein